NNLSFVRDRLLRSESGAAALLDLYAQLRGGQRVAADYTNPLVEVLRLSGIVRVRHTDRTVRDGAAARFPLRRHSPLRIPDSPLLEVRNRIYERVFDTGWIRDNMPDAERRRQRAAYRRGAARSGGVFSVALAATAMALVAYTQHEQAQTQREHA